MFGLCKKLHKTCNKKKIVVFLHLIMKRSAIIEERRKHASPETRKEVDLAFQIIDAIYKFLPSRNNTILPSR